MPCAWPVTEEMKNPPHYPLTDVARYQGDGVAVVIAESRAQAKDAAELVEIDWEPLDAIVDVAKALEDGAPLAHPDLGTNECYVWRLDTDATGQAIEDADVVVDAPLLPAAADPERDRAARRARRPRDDGRLHALLGDADPAHPAPARSGDARHARDEAARRRARRRRRLRLEARRLRGGAPRDRARPPARPARQVDRGALGELPRDDPRPRLRHRVHASARRRTARSPIAARGSRRRWARTSSSSRPASRCSGRGSTPGRTRSRTTASCSRASSRTRRRPTRIAAPVGPRRPT